MNKPQRTSPINSLNTQKVGTGAKRDVRPNYRSAFRLSSLSSFVVFLTPSMWLPAKYLCQYRPAPSTFLPIIIL